MVTESFRSNAARLLCAAALGTLACGSEQPSSAKPSKHGPDSGVGEAGRDAGSVTEASTAERRDSTSDAGCFGGRSFGGAVTVACGSNAPGPFATDDGAVYWTIEAAGTVVARSRFGSETSEVVATDVNGAFGIVVVSGSVYFTEPAAGRVMRVASSGGVPEAVAAKVDAPLRLAADASNLYFTAGRTTGFIGRLALPNGAVQTLAAGLGKPRAIAVDGRFVYWTDFADGSVARAEITTDGGLARAVALTTGIQQPSDLAVTGGYVYFPDQSGRLLRIPVGGGVLEKVADAEAPFGVATDGSFVYATTKGGVLKAPVAGGSTTVLATFVSDPHFVALGGGSVYWGNWGDGTVRRAPQ